MGGADELTRARAHFQAAIRLRKEMKKNGPQDGLIRSLRFHIQASGKLASDFGNGGVRAGTLTAEAMLGRVAR